MASAIVTDKVAVAYTDEVIKLSTKVQARITSADTDTILGKEKLSFDTTKNLIGRAVEPIPASTPTASMPTLQYLFDTAKNLATGSVGFAPQKEETAPPPTAESALLGVYELKELQNKLMTEFQSTSEFPGPTLGAGPAMADATKQILADVHIALAEVYSRGIYDADGQDVVKQDKHAYCKLLNEVVKHKLGSNETRGLAAYQLAKYFKQSSLSTKSTEKTKEKAQKFFNYYSEIAKDLNNENIQYINNPKGLDKGTYVHKDYYHGRELMLAEEYDEAANLLDDYVKEQEEKVGGETGRTNKSKIYAAQCEHEMVKKGGTGKFSWNKLWTRVQDFFKRGTRNDHQGIMSFLRGKCIANDGKRASSDGYTAKKAYEMAALRGNGDATEELRKKETVSWRDMSVSSGEDGLKRLGGLIDELKNFRQDNIGCFGAYLGAIEQQISALEDDGYGDNTEFKQLKRNNVSFIYTFEGKSEGLQNDINSSPFDMKKLEATIQEFANKYGDKEPRVQKVRTTWKNRVESMKQELKNINAILNQDK